MTEFKYQLFIDQVLKKIKHKNKILLLQSKSGHVPKPTQHNILNVTSNISITSL